MLNKYKVVILLSLIYSFFFCVWLLGFYPLNINYNFSELFTDTYGLVALIGSMLGFIISKRWGFMKSVLGRALFFLSLGLLLQFLGQVVYSYYALFLGVEVPYPSWGDLGYFGSIPAYIYAIYLVAHASGYKFSLKSYANRVWVILIPVTILLFSYFVFLYEYDFSVEQVFSLKFILDFGYPLGQAFYLSIATLTLVLTRKYLGGALRKSVLLLLLAFLAQYLADFVFLYRSSRELWVAGGVSDLAYLVSYWVMTMALLSFNDVFLMINKKGNSNEPR